MTGWDPPRLLLRSASGKKLHVIPGECRGVPSVGVKKGETVKL